MIHEDIIWHEDYAIGVEEIDAAHKEFFRIVRRLLMVSKNRKSHEWAAQEGVKFLKNYVLTHFAEEEDYMRSIGYKYLDQHIAQHDVLRHRVAPRIEGHLHQHGYSEEALQKFFNILTLWISRHILVHDKAISWEKASPLLI